LIANSQIEAALMKIWTDESERAAWAAGLNCSGLSTDQASHIVSAFTYLTSARG
jgi:hypothetical protein